MIPDQQESHCPDHSPEELSLFLSGDLSPRRTRNLLQHLPRCAVCRQRLRELEAVRHLLQRAPTPLPPRSYILSPADIPSRRKILWYPILRSATTAIAAVVLVIFVASLLLPAALEPAAPTPQAVSVKSTTRATPTPQSAIVGPAITRRNPPTTATGLVTPLPAHIGGTAYPAPSGRTSPRIYAVTPEHPTPPAIAKPDAAAGPPIITFVRVGGLLLLGLVAGLTWLAYRRERVFLV